MGSDPNVFRYKLFCMGSGLSIIPGMVDYSKTDLRFPTSGQQAHDAQIIHLVLFIHSLEMFIFSLWGLTPVLLFRYKLFFMGVTPILRIPWGLTLVFAFFVIS